MTKLSIAIDNQGRLRFLQWPYIFWTNLGDLRL